VDRAEAVEPAGAATHGPAGSTVVTGFMLGLFGYLAALVVFGYVGLFTGDEDAGDQLAAGLAAAYAIALVATVTALVAVLRRRRRPRTAVGLLAGMAVGIALLVLLTVRIVGLMDEVASTCPCEPIIDQIRSVGD
jgi:predicted Co/Zn/Cd cation transporter (cation efflux family)